MTDSPANTPAAAGKPAPQSRDPSRRGVQITLALIGLTLLWYLLADRYTPYTQQARVQAYVVAVAPEVAGRISRVLVGNNQMVEAGQVLFEINPEPYAIAVGKARAELENMRGQVGASTAAIDSALASQRAAEAGELEARQDRDRLERLYREDPGTISLRRLEISRANLVQASSQVAAARAEVQRARETEGGSGEDNARLRSAAAALEQAELDLTKTQVRAASTGLITDLRSEVGQYAAAGNPQMTLIGLNDLWISAEMSENNLGHLQPGTPVAIVLDARPGHVYRGKIRSIGYGVSVGQSSAPGSLPTVENNRDWLRAAQRFPVVVEFEAGELGDYRGLRVGGQAEVMAFPSEGNPLNPLGRAFLRVMSWLSFAY
ncbi:HlyD family efflux transporter periplasmic adaptor subunit [Pseudomonas sp. R-28-1W-6]|jgi:multidrug resistance efflux pump|uniref:HlyD family secretion protein n=1 Tax=Pseudomonas sp. R-28-1W-6 TaxID=2650101 RepID=UPI001365F80D|nr:HlyD family secretion protein [Pseudomonas sp. R-28-1W-6]MWV13456.1 HlyD family efflux transporter periplasmic adaptor subunit [Pseudomonas sp. R-28-1W-6]